MAITIDPENKNTALSITNEAKTSGNATTWAEHSETWEDTSGTWERPETPLALESKNSLSISNETKN